ncbi:MAG: ribosomal protein S18-alanine N-acetyltransferase [Clostridia bacterium]|nr:ribosomal protein S18-alanine N-acetyltransferase [Clostridia bacterium]
MKIEIMKENHISQVSEIARQSLPDAWSESAFSDELKNKAATVFVALSDNRPIGFGGVQKVLDEAYITNIAVKKEARRKGVGKALLKAIINHCADSSFVSLEVRVSNSAAIKLYEKSGFVSQGIRKNFYSHPSEDANIMTLFLGE